MILPGLYIQKTDTDDGHVILTDGFWEGMRGSKQIDSHTHIRIKHFSIHVAYLIHARFHDAYNMVYTGIHTRVIVGKINI